IETLPALPYGDPATIGYHPHALKERGLFRMGNLTMSLAATREPDAPTPPLVGREVEQGILHARLDAALAGRGGLVLLSGEAGVGKSALAEDLCYTATQRGVVTLTGHCYDLTETPPYGPRREILDRCRASLPPLPDAPPPPLPDFATAASQTALFAQA